MQNSINPFDVSRILIKMHNLFEYAQFFLAPLKNLIIAHDLKSIRELASHEISS